MKRLAGRHTRRMNSLLRKTGTVWEGRFHCSPIDTARYLLTCGRLCRSEPGSGGHRGAARRLRLVELSCAGRVRDLRMAG
jgi:hypothetical protein